MIYNNIHLFITDVNNVHGMYCTYGCGYSTICAAGSALASAVTIPGYDKLTKLERILNNLNNADNFFYSTFANVTIEDFNIKPKNQKIK